MNNDKMQTALTASYDGKVSEIMLKPGDSVPAGAILMIVS